MPIPSSLLRFKPAGLLLLLYAASSASAECTSGGGFCDCPPEEETYDEGDLGSMYPDVCTPPSPPAACPASRKLVYGSSTTTAPPAESSADDLCGDGDFGGARLLLRGPGGGRKINNDEHALEKIELHPSNEHLEEEYVALADEGRERERELGWGDWSDADSWGWYFCGGGVDVPLTMTGWEPEIKALWMKRHAKQMLADICAGKLAGGYGIGRWDSIWNLGVTWIGGFGLGMTAVPLGQVNKDGKCYKKYAVTVTFNDHFDCDPGGGDTYHVKHKWNFHAYCEIPCTTTTEPTTTTTTTPSVSSSSSSTTQTTTDSNVSSSTSQPQSSTVTPESSTSSTQQSSTVESESSTSSTQQSSTSTHYYDTTYDPYYYADIMNP